MNTQIKKMKLYYKLDVLFYFFEVLEFGIKKYGELKTGNGKQFPFPVM